MDHEKKLNQLTQHPLLEGLLLFVSQNTTSQRIVVYKNDMWAKHRLTGQNELLREISIILESPESIGIGVHITFIKRLLDIHDVHFIIT